MNSWVVADSGIALAIALPNETYKKQAEGLWQQWTSQNIQIAAPTLYTYEIVAVIRKHVHRGNLSNEDGLQFLTTLLEQPINLMVSPTLLRRAYELATQLNRPSAYDAQYLALAEHLQCDFWTADEKLFNAVHPTLPTIHWIGDFSTP